MDNNPVDYAWTQFAGGFGTTNGMYYQPMGGGAISFFIGNTAPTINFSPVIDNTPINLDVLANSIVTTHSILPGAVTGNLIAQATLTGNLIAAATITGNLIGTATVLGTNLVPNTITGNLIAQNTITGNLVVPGTITGNLILASTITGDLIAANTINATSIVAGSITSTQLQANLLSVGNIVSFGQTIESNSGVGYWLDYTNGNVYLGGNTHIGGNLTVGNNAVIGNNLTVNGLIILGAFESNTVVTNTIVDSSVTYGVSVYTNTVQDTYYTVAQLVGGGGPLSNQPNYYTAGNVVMLCDESPEPLYIWSTQLGEVLISKSTSGSITFTVTYWLSRFYANNVLASDYTYSDPAYTMTGYAGSYPFRPIFQIADYVTSAPGYYLYTAGVQVGFMSNYCAAPEFANVQVVYNQGTSIIQDFKK
jgi:cytoskeletal protein CcmA (bactofilin family)